MVSPCNEKQTVDKALYTLHSYFLPYHSAWSCTVRGAWGPTVERGDRLAMDGTHPLGERACLAFSGHSLAVILLPPLVVHTHATLQLLFSLSFNHLSYPSCSLA